MLRHMCMCCGKSVSLESEHGEAPLTEWSDIDAATEVFDEVCMECGWAMWSTVGPCS